MSYRRLYSFKTGISPSLLDSFPTDGKYSGTQKLLLIRTRIFGDKIGGVYPSGLSEFRKTSRGRSMLNPHKYSLYEMPRFFPGMEKYSDREFEKQFLQEKVDRKQIQRIRREEAKQREKEKK